MSGALEKASAVGYSEPEDVLSAEGGKMFVQNLGQDSCQKLPSNPYLVDFLGSGDLCFNSSNCVSSLSFVLRYCCDGFGEPGKEAKQFPVILLRWEIFAISISEVADRGLFLKVLFTDKVSFYR